MAATHASGRHARIDVTLDGIRITRTASDAGRRHTARSVEIGWDEVEGATLQTTGQGRAVIRIAVAGAPVVTAHRDDPYAVKISRAEADIAPALVDLVNTEVQDRRRWRQHAATMAQS